MYNGICVLVSGTEGEYPMATVIAISIQKGGSGKTTTSAMLAYMLSRQYKTLAVDMDSQGNLTELLSRVDDIDVFRNQTILQAMQEGDVRPYVKQITETLHLAPADDFLATFGNWLYLTYLPEVRNKKRPPTDVNLLLRNALEPVMGFYDYIVVDTPPALSEQTMNALGAANWVIVPFETSRFCYSALRNFFGTLEAVTDSFNPNIEIAGILRSLIDNRRKDAKEFIELVEETWKDYCPIFEKVINRTAAVGRLTLSGLGEDNPELSQALKEYEPFYEELMSRVSHKTNTKRS